MTHCHLRGFRWLLVTSCIAGWLSEPVLAQQNAGANRFAVDLVTLKSGERLRGAMLGLTPDGSVSMAVQREWLKASRPEFYEQSTRNESAAELQIATSLRDRIRVWLNEGGHSDGLAAFLRIDLEQAEKRCAKLTADPGSGRSSQFLMLTLPKSDLTYHFAQAPANRQIALLAWNERLKDVEQREADDLASDLKRRGIDPAIDTADLTSRLPDEPQDETQWSARRAIVEFHFGTKLEFQGMGGSLIRTGSGGQPAALEQLLPQLLPQLLQNQLADQLGGLLDDPAAQRNAPGAGQAGAAPQLDLKPAIAAAEREQVRGFRVTQLDLNLPQGRTRVIERFIARTPDGKWQSIFQTEVTSDASQARPDAQKQIAEDPQIAQVLKLLQGIAPGADQQMNTALRFGAATMDAQKKADAAYFAFRDRFVQRLSGPPLKW